tara:strand:- start:2972 stop:3097 length:126 start_codon:yes stop_codon:yes gene_type:complete
MNHIKKITLKKDRKDREKIEEIWTFSLIYLSIYRYVFPSIT